MFAALERRAGVLTFAWRAYVAAVDNESGSAFVLPHQLFHISAIAPPPLQIHIFLRERARGRISFWTGLLLQRR